MANLEHASIPNANLHEPKGVSAAAINTVYVADGAGSGSWQAQAAASSGTVTSVGWIGGIVSVATPTATPAFTVNGTSGGIPYFSGAATWQSSAALAANAIVLGGGAGASPATTTTGSGVVTALGVNVSSAGAFVVNGGAGGTPTSITLTNGTGLPITGISSFTLAQLNTAVSNADVAQLGANTFTADQTYAENAGIVLDAALSADGKYSGIVEAGTSAAALAFGELCYRVTATGKWALASGAAAGVGAVISTGELGMCVLAAAGADAATTMLKYGKIRADALFDTFTVGAPVYMSAATAGKVVSAAPTGTTDFTVRKVGHAEDANTVWFAPSNDFITLA